MTTDFEALQNWVVDRLTVADAKDYFNQSVPLPVTDDGSTIPVVSEVKGDIENQLETALAALGIAMIVVTPTAKQHQAGVLALDLDSQLKVQVQERRTINQTGVHALALVVFVLRRISFIPHNLYGAARRPHRILPQEQLFTLLSAGDGQNPELIYDVDFTAPLNLNLTLA